MTLRWREIEGVPECVGLAIEVVDNSPLVLNEAALRRLNLSRLIAGVRAKLITAAEPEVARPPRMRPKTWQRLQEIARIYREALAAGSHPTQAVQQHLGVSAGYAANLVFKAREARLLPPTSAGVAIGEVDDDPGRQ